MGKRPPLGIYNTAMCARCLKRTAKFHAGHVLVGKRRITAGWCSQRCCNSAGFFGQWLPAMNPGHRVTASNDKGRAL